jgi:hypothetical protein
MARASTHKGPYQTIPDNSSPGLGFLKAFLPALDSLEPEINPLIPFLAPEAHFIINGGAPTLAETVIAMLKMRSQKVKVFHHTVKSVWDVQREDGNRTVMYESVSETVLKDDPEDASVEVAEFSIIELAPYQDGIEGLAVTELRTYMDAQQVTQRLKQIGNKSA